MAEVITNTLYYVPFQFILSFDPKTICCAYVSVRYSLILKCWLWVRFLIGREYLNPYSTYKWWSERQFMSSVFPLTSIYHSPAIIDPLLSTVVFKVAELSNLLATCLPPPPSPPAAMHKTDYRFSSPSLSILLMQELTGVFSLFIHFLDKLEESSISTNFSNFQHLQSFTRKGNIKLVLGVLFVYLF